jgi:hypothetical protein
MPLGVRLDHLAAWLVLSGCAAAAPAPLEPVQFLSRVVEVGPLEVGTTQQIEQPFGRARDGLPALRVESWGETELDLSLWGPHAVLLVQGPLPGPDGDDPGPSPVVAAGAEHSGSGVHLSRVRLAKAGVYRVIVATDAALRGDDGLRGTLTLESRCTSGLGCGRPFLTPAQLLERLHALGTDRLLAMEDSTAIPRGQRSEYLLGLKQILHNWGSEGVGDRPLFGLDQAILPMFLQSVVEVGGSEWELEDRDLMARLGGCDIQRSRQLRIIGDLSVGQFPDRSLTLCQVAHSVRFAQVMNQLANNRLAAHPVPVFYRGRPYTSSADLVGALMQAGHKVELVEERSYAPLVPWTWGELDVLWPVWLDTGISIDGKAPLRMPAGRSRSIWIIRGPDVDVRVTLGVGFRSSFEPVVDRQPLWVGKRLVSVSSNPQQIVEGLAIAEAFVEMTELGTTEHGAWGGSPFGTASDAAALLARVVNRVPDAALPYPLVRRVVTDPKWLRTSPRPDAVRNRMVGVMSALPCDASPREGDSRVPALRLFGMMPHAFESPVLDALSPKLRAQTCQLARALDAPEQPTCAAIRSAHGDGPG